MKRLLATLLLLCSVWNILAADSTIGNLTPLVTVPDTYRMPWENPGVLDYYITFMGLTNQILAQMANQAYAVQQAQIAAQNSTNGFPWLVLSATLADIQHATNDLNSALVLKISQATNTLAINLLTTFTAGTNDLSSVLKARMDAGTNDLNTALVTKIQGATNDLNTGLTTKITSATNDLSTVLKARMDAGTNDLSTVLKARMDSGTNDLNTALTTKINTVTNGLIGQAPSDNQYYGQANGSWKALPIGANLTYYLEPTNSSVANILAQDVGLYPLVTAIDFASLAVGTYVLTNFITPPSVPNTAFLPAGVYELHIHAAQPTGNRVCALYAEFWEASSVGADIAKIGTTEVTSTLTTTTNEWRLFFTDNNPYTFGSTASRVVCRVYVIASAGGSAPTVRLSVGGNSDSHIALPALTPATTTVTLSGDATGSGSSSIAVTVTNLQQTLITNQVHWTNVVSLTNSQFQKVDMAKKEGDFETNAGFAFLGLINLSKTNYQSVVVTVHNTTGSVVPITAPVNTFTNGFNSYTVTNFSKVLFYYTPIYNYTSMYVFPEW